MKTKRINKKRMMQMVLATEMQMQEAREKKRKGRARHLQDKWEGMLTMCELSGVFSETELYEMQGHYDFCEVARW